MFARLHDDAGARLANAAALARFAARVLNWLWLDDRGNAGRGGRHVTVIYIRNDGISYGRRRRTRWMDESEIVSVG